VPPSRLADADVHDMVVPDVGATLVAAHSENEFGSDIQGRFRLPPANTGVLSVSDSILDPGVRSMSLFDERQLADRGVGDHGLVAPSVDLLTGTAARPGVVAPGVL
jgi:hypothetical protein